MPYENTVSRPRRTTALSCPYMMQPQGLLSRSKVKSRQRINDVIILHCQLLGRLVHTKPLTIEEEAQPATWPHSGQRPGTPMEGAFAGSLEIWSMGMALA